MSESGALALILHCQMPENRALRQWLTMDVVPKLRQGGPGTLPAMSAMCTQAGEVKVLYWQDEAWVQLKDMPAVLTRSQPAKGQWWRVWG